jgi:hypothetical protein
MKFKGLVLSVLVLGVGGVLLSGCCIPSGLSSKIGDQVGKSVESGVKKSIEKNTGVKVESGDSAEAAGTDLKSVPPYTGAKRTFYIKGEPVNGNISVSITYQTSDDPAKVLAFYKEKMAALGWTVSLTVAGQDGGEMVSYDKGDNNTTATVNVTKSNGKTDITVMYNGVEAGA